MSKETEALDELKAVAGEGLQIDESKFKTVEEIENENSADLAELEKVGEDISPNILEKKKTIEEKMEELGMSKDIAIDMIMELSDSGYITEKFTLFGGKFTAEFKTAKIADTKRFVDLFDAMDVNTQAKAEYYLNLYALASILDNFNGDFLDSDDIVARANWIEEKIPVPLYKKLLDTANKFHAKIELLSSEEVANFF